MTEDLTALYDHSEYGEAYDAMARHAADMSGLECMSQQVHNGRTR